METAMLENRRILLGITGSIAAYGEGSDNETNKKHNYPR
jgi:hypothetical protein